MDRAQDAVYGFDIETDTVVDGLDPGRSRHRGRRRGHGRADGGLRRRRRGRAARPARLVPGVARTGRGGHVERVRLRSALRGRPGPPPRAHPGPRLRIDPAIARRHPPLAGHAGAYRASWHSHAHLDGYQVFRADVSPVPRRVELAQVGGPPVRPRPIAARRGRPAPSSPGDEVRAYVASDARCTRELVARRWPHRLPRRRRAPAGLRWPRRARPGPTRSPDLASGRVHRRCHRAPAPSGHSPGSRPALTPVARRSRRPTRRSIPRSDPCR